MDDCVDALDGIVEGARNGDIGYRNVFKKRSVDGFESWVCEEARGCSRGAGCAADGVALLEELEGYVRGNVAIDACQENYF